MAYNIQSHEKEDLQTRLFYPARLSSFKIEEEIKNSQEKAKEIHYHQTSITRNMKGSSLRRVKKKIIKNKMVINKYLTTITLNINSSNTSIKRHRVAEWIRKGHTYMLFIKHLPQNEIYKENKSKGMEKSYFMQMKMKGKLWKQYIYQTKETLKQSL